MNLLTSIQSPQRRDCDPPHNLGEIERRKMVGVLAFVKQPARKIIHGQAIDEMSEAGRDQCVAIRQALRSVRATQVSGYCSTARRANDALRLILADHTNSRNNTHTALEPLRKDDFSAQFETARKDQIDQITKLVKRHICEAQALAKNIRMLCVHITHSHIVEKLLASFIVGEGRLSAEDLVGETLAPGTLWQLQIFKNERGILELEVSLGRKVLQARPGLLPSLLS